jgi:hypothetical protein
MKLEAELDGDISRFTTLFHDDETREEFEKKKTESILEVTSPEQPSPASTSIAPMPEQSQGLDFGSYQRSISELALGQRMKSASQVMLAPCVAPGLSNVFLCRNNSEITTQKDNSEKEIEVRTSPNVRSDRSPLNHESTEQIVSPGSDLGDDDHLPQHNNAFLVPLRDDLDALVAILDESRESNWTYRCR